MSKNKKDKKKKKKQKQLEQVQAEQKKFDIIELLENEQLDTKPNFAKFLDSYVERISVVVNNGKIQFYPTIEYSFPKIFVLFLDKHELMYSKDIIPGKQHYCLYDDEDEIELDQKQIQLVEIFFQRLFEFKFIKQIRE